MLRLSTFGGLGLAKDGAALSGAAVQRSRLSLLALLATAGQAGVSRDKLLLYLWPESDEERARHALKQAVYSLRRELGDDEVIVGTASLSLNPAIITSDVREFDAALAAGDWAAAVALYSGPFLDGVHLKDSVEFERWSAETRAQYAHLWASAVERLAADAESRGAWRDAVGFWRRLAAVEPLSGRLAAALIRCLAEGGDVGAAMQHFRVHEALLMEEMSTAPDADVTALVESIRGGTWQRSPERKSPVPGARSMAHSTPHGDASVGAALDSGSATVPSVVAPVAPALGETAPRWRRQALRFLGAMALIAATAGLYRLWVIYRALPVDQRAQLLTVVFRGDPILAPRLIVVTTFENKTGDTTINWLGEQTASWLTRQLGEADFDVVPARQAQVAEAVVERIPFFLRPRDPNIAQGKENGAAYVVTGEYFPLGRDSVSYEVSVIDVASHQKIYGLGPFHGSRTTAEDVLRRMIPPTIAYLATHVDTSAAGHTVSLTSPPTPEAGRLTTSAWEEFFVNPMIPGPPLLDLAKAAKIDPTYPTPVLMTAYIYDVKSQWSATKEMVERARPLMENMSRPERVAMELFDADLRGDAMRRVGISHRLQALSPGSTEMTLLVVLSAMYVGRPHEAMAAFATTDPDFGMNIITPTFWEWRGLTQHYLEDNSGEANSAREALRRFPLATSSWFCRARVLAAKNDRALDEVLARGVPGAANPVEARQELTLFAAQELRTHGFAARADSIFQRVAAEMATTPATAPVADRRRQAVALYDAKRYAEARAVLEVLAGDTMDIDALGRLGSVAWRLGDSATARRIDGQLARMHRPFQMGRPTKWRANLAAVEGKLPEAAAFLETAIRTGYRFMDSPGSNLTVHTDADFVALRASPAFAALLRTLADGEGR